MESPAAGTQRSGSRPRRKPLQPKNFQADPSAGNPTKPKPKPVQISTMRLPAKEDADKENRPGSAVAEGAEVGRQLEASLAEELVAVRRRKERLRSERERTEEALRGRDEVLERGMREVERRWEEQRKLEMKIQRMIRLKDIRSSCTISSPFQSLRAKEQEKRRIEAQLQGVECVKNDQTTDETAESSSAMENGTNS